MVHLHRSGCPQVLIAARILPLLLAAAILPACGFNGQPRKDVDVVVHNQGAEPVRVRIETKQPNDDDVDELIIAAGSSAQFDFDDITKLEITVYRVSDNFLLFLDSWDEDDLRRENDFISVTVIP